MDITDITQNVKQNDVRGLNICTAYPVSNLFVETNVYTQSDDDEQLILHIPFTQPISLWSIWFDIFTDDTHPILLKLFINMPSITFSDVDDIVPKSIIKFESMNDRRRVQIEKKVERHRFRKVNSLTIYVEDNNGSEISRLFSIGFKGKILSNMDLQKLKKC